MRKVTSRLRQDGERTREKLIEEAGKLVAARGWSAVTARDVCHKAQVNAASINYWFGGREALYQSVLERIPPAIFSQELEIEMVQYESAEAALDFYFTSLIQRVLQEDNWPIRVWVREAVAPSSRFREFVENYAKGRIIQLKSFFATYLEIEDCEDPRVESALLLSLSPIFMFAIIDPWVKAKMLPSSVEQTEAFSKILKEKILASLRLLREQLHNSSNELLTV